MVWNDFRRRRVAEGEQRRSSVGSGAASPTGLHLRNPHISPAEPLPVASAAPPAASPNHVPICLLPSVQCTGSTVRPPMECGFEHGVSERDGELATREAPPAVTEPVIAATRQV